MKNSDVLFLFDDSMNSNDRWLIFFVSFLITQTLILHVASRAGWSWSASARQTRLASGTDINDFRQSM